MSCPAFAEVESPFSADPGSLFVGIKEVIDELLSTDQDSCLFESPLDSFPVAAAGKGADQQGQRAVHGPFHQEKGRHV